MAQPDTSDDCSTRDANDVARDFAADLEAGLTSAEVARRLVKDGTNELRAPPPVPAWRRVLAHFQDPLVDLLLAAIAIALTAWAVEGRHGWPVDATVIAAVVLLNAVLGYVQEAKAVDAVAALDRMTAATSAVLHDGQEQRVTNAASLGAQSFFSPLASALALHCCAPTPLHGSPT